MLADKGTSVRMGLETMGKQNQLGTLDEVLRLCAIAPPSWRQSSISGT